MTTETLKPMSIFVVDDHPLMREAVVMLIRRLNSKANIVELDRVAAVTPAIQKHGTPELICLDLKLPDTHGVSGVRELKLLYPDVPLVVLSASPALDYEDLSIEAGLTLIFKNQLVRLKSRMRFGYFWLMTQTLRPAPCLRNSPNDKNSCW